MSWLQSQIVFQIGQSMVGRRLNEMFEGYKLFARRSPVTKVIGRKQAHVHSVLQYQ